MEKIHFSIIINATKEKIWEILWQDISYRKWAATFGEGSHVITDNWKTGSQVLFLGEEGSGMVSKVAANKPNEFMSFMHLGEIKNGIEDTSSEKIKQWHGSMEDYTLTEADGKTTLTVDMDINETYKDFFVKTWPLALEKVKTLSEQ